MVEHVLVELEEECQLHNILDQNPDYLRYLNQNFQLRTIAFPILALAQHHLAPHPIRACKNEL